MPWKWGPLTRTATRRLHLTASVGATVSVAVLLAGTLIVEPVASEATVRALRRAIVTGLPLLVAFMALAGITGVRLAGGSRAPAIRRKRRRTAVIAGIGALALIPTAVLLDRWAARGEFGASFTVLAAVEPALGAVNLALLLANLRAGVRLTRRPARATVSR